MAKIKSALIIDNNPKKMKEAFRYLFTISIIFIFIPNMVFSQHDENSRYFSFTGAFILNADFESEIFLKSGYLAASLHN